MKKTEIQPTQKMKKFPSKFSPKNKEKFPEIWHNRVKCYMRRDIFEHVLSHTEDEYFSLDMFDKKINDEKSDMKLVKEICEELIPEIRQTGWNCTLAFGGSGLFIHSTEKPPKNCW